MKQRYVPCEFCDGFGQIFYPHLQDFLSCEVCEGEGQLFDYDYDEDADDDQEGPWPGEDKWEGDDNAD